MLNIGQVVYDYENERVVLFAGQQMFQSQKTGKCHFESAFILKDGTFIHYKDKEDDPPKFGYTNFNRDGRILVGLFINKLQIDGCYFGIIDIVAPDVKKYAKEAIEEVEALIEEHGLTKEIKFTERNGEQVPHTEIYIGEVKKAKREMVISTPT